MVENLVKNVLISRNSDTEFKGSWYLISRFDHILEDFEINRLPIWYDHNSLSADYIEIESKLILSFNELFKNYKVSVVTFSENFDDFMELLKLNATWLNEDHFDDFESFRLFILFNLRKKNFLKRNFLKVENQFILEINDNLEINIFCNKNLKPNDITKFFVNNGLYEHKIKINKFLLNSDNAL